MVMKKNLKRMKRKDLLEILLIQNKKIYELQETLSNTRELLEKKEMIISEAGSIAEASLKLNNIFDVAQKAADDYLRNVKEMDKSNNQKEKQEYNNKTVIKEVNKKNKEC